VDRTAGPECDVFADFAGKQAEFVRARGQVFWYRHGYLTFGGSARVHGGHVLAVAGLPDREEADPIGRGGLDRAHHPIRLKGRFRGSRCGRADAIVVGHDKVDGCLFVVLRAGDEQARLVGPRGAGEGGGNRT